MPRSIFVGVKIDNRHFLVVSVLEPVKLKMISVFYLQTEMDKLQGNKDYTEVLECGRYEPKEGEPAPAKKPKKDSSCSGPP